MDMACFPFTSFLKEASDNSNGPNVILDDLSIEAIWRRSANELALCTSSLVLFAQFGQMLD